MGDLSEYESIALRHSLDAVAQSSIRWLPDYMDRMERLIEEYRQLVERHEAAIRDGDTTDRPTDDCEPLCATTGHNHDVDDCEACGWLVDMGVAVGLATTLPAPEEQPCPDCDDRGYTVRSDPRDPTGSTPEQVQCNGPKHWTAAIEGDAP